MAMSRTYQLQHQKIVENVDDNDIKTIQRKLQIVRLAAVALIAFGVGFQFPEYEFQNNINRRQLMLNETVLENMYYRVYKMQVLERFTVEHIEMVLHRLGYAEALYRRTWDLFWAKEFSLSKLYTTLRNMEPSQKFNYFIPLAHISNKSFLSTTNNYVPKSFRLPDGAKELQEYSAKNPHLHFMQKNNNHRGNSIKPIDKIDLNNSKIFVQQYVDNPLLIDGHKFDIGVYTIVTSLDPLRVYIYNGDILFRFCLTKYHPFDPSNIDKYVMQGVYKPTWKMPSLSRYFNAAGLGMRDSFDAYMKSKGLDYRKIWSQIEQIIIEIFMTVGTPNIGIEPNQNFFELLRIDFLVDNNLKVHLLEVNAGPNLCSKHVKENVVLYEQLLYSVFSLVGVAQRTRSNSLRKSCFESQIMLTAERNIIMATEEVHGANNCTGRCNASECILRRECLDLSMIKTLHEAFKEHINRLECKRVFPPTMNGEDLSEEFLGNFSQRNQIMMKWFNGKCKEDASWC